MQKKINKLKIEIIQYRNMIINNIEGLKMNVIENNNKQ